MKRKVLWGLFLVTVVAFGLSNVTVSKNAEISPPEPMVIVSSSL